MGVSSSLAGQSLSNSSSPRATTLSCAAWASKKQRRPPAMAVKAQDLTKDYKYGFSDPEQYSFKSRRGLDPEIVKQISAFKKEPEWMLQFRLRALDIFRKKPMPTWPAADLPQIDFENNFSHLCPPENTPAHACEAVHAKLNE